MESIILQILNGLDKGSAYALIALGLTLIFGTLGVVNFAHGALFMLGAFVAVTVKRILNLSFETIDPTRTDFLGNPMRVSTPYVESWFGPEIGAATLVRGGPSGFAVSFPSPWLTLPIAPTTQVNQPQKGAAPGPPRDLAAALRAAIRAQLHDHELGMEKAAAELGMRPRTLRKELAGRGLGLRELIDGERQQTLSYSTFPYFPRNLGR